MTIKKRQNVHFCCTLDLSVWGLRFQGGVIATRLVVKGSSVDLFSPLIQAGIDGNATG